ncbi:MAG: MFS transporter [Pseudomonadota bacterium]
MKLIPLLSICTGFFMVIIDATIVNVALPTIGIALNASVSWLQWILAGYTLMFASLLLLAGYMSDLFGAKKLFQSGVIVFTLASFLCGLSNSAWMLTLFRLLQGAAAAFMVPTSLALINASFPNDEMRARAIGIWAAIGGVAVAIGPILGAILTSLFNWHAIFFINIPFGLACFIVTAIFVINPTSNPPKTKFDSMGQLFGIIAVASLAFAFIEAGRLGWTSVIVISAFVLFVISTVGFIVTELLVKTPMLPLGFFKYRNFSISTVVAMTINVGFYGELFLFPLYFHHIRHYSVLTTGFALLPLVIMNAICAYFAGKLVGVIGTKKPMLYGLLCGGVGFLALLVVIKYTLPYSWFILPFAIIGSGLSFTMPAATIAIIRSVSHHQAGMASGVFNTSRQIGSLIGVAVFGTIIAVSSTFISGMELTLIIAVGVLLLASLLTMLMSEQRGEI